MEPRKIVRLNSCHKNSGRLAKDQKHSVCGKVMRVETIHHVHGHIKRGLGSSNADVATLLYILVWSGYCRHRALQKVLIHEAVTESTFFTASLEMDRIYVFPLSLSFMIVKHQYFAFIVCYEPVPSLFRGASKVNGEISLLP